MLFVRIIIPAIAFLILHLTIKHRSHAALKEIKRLELPIPTEIQDYLKAQSLSEPTWLFFIVSLYFYFVLPENADIMEVWMWMLSSLPVVIIARFFLAIKASHAYEKMFKNILRRDPSKEEDLMRTKNFLTVSLKPAAGRRKNRDLRF